MFGFIKNDHDMAVISNRIYEAVLYNYFLAEEFADSKIYNAGLQEKNRFIVGGHLDVRRVLEKFVETFDDLYGDQNETFWEEAGRCYFILFLKPIINGTGSYSVESQTRNSEIQTKAPADFQTPLQKSVYETLEKLQIPFERVDTEEAIIMEDCAAINQKLDMKMVKTLFLCNRQQTLFYLFITAGNKPFCSKGFSHALGVPRVSFAPAVTAPQPAI